MPLNVLAGQTASQDNKPKQTAFEAYQSTIKNLQPMQSRLGNVFGIAGRTTGNINKQSQNVIDTTGQQKQKFSDTNIKNQMDALKTQHQQSIGAVGNQLNQKAQAMGTISFPGSPSDETIKALNSGTYQADTTTSLKELQDNSQLIRADLADGNMDDPRVVELFKSNWDMLKGLVPAASSAGGGSTATPADKEPWVSPNKGTAKDRGLLESAFGLVNRDPDNPSPQKDLGRIPEKVDPFIFQKPGLPSLQDYGYPPMDSPAVSVNPVESIDTAQDWAANYQTAANAYNAQKDALRAQALSDLLGIKFDVADDVTPRDTWDEQARQTSDLENLAYAQGQMLESPNSGLNSVYGALGVGQTGNAYFDALTREAARPEALNAIREAQGTTSARSGALNQLGESTNQYGKAMQDIQSRWDTAATGAKNEAATRLQQAQSDIGNRDIGKLSAEQMAAKTKELSTAQTTAKGIKDTNKANKDYIDLLKQNVAKAAPKMVQSYKEEIPAAASKLSRTRGVSEEGAQKIMSTAAESGVAPAAVERALSELSDEELSKIAEDATSSRETATKLRKIFAGAGLVFPPARIGEAIAEHKVGDYTSKIEEVRTEQMNRLTQALKELTAPKWDTAPRATDKPTEGEAGEVDTSTKETNKESTKEATKESTKESESDKKKKPVTRGRVQPTEFD